MFILMQFQTYRTVARIVQIIYSDHSDYLFRLLLCNSVPIWFVILSLSSSIIVFLKFLRVTSSYQAPKDRLGIKGMNIFEILKIVLGTHHKLKKD